MDEPKHNWSLAASFMIAITMMTPISSAQTPAPTGAELYKDNCAICHGVTGAGSTLGKRLNTPDLRSNQIQQKPSSILTQTISTGKKNMPSFATKLSANEIEMLVAYLRQFNRRIHAH